jgi:hypothetical protein
MPENPGEIIKGFDFGQLIAFILPGIVSARALGYYLPSVQRAMDKASTGGEGVSGPLIWLLFVAATSGLTISVVRQQWFDLLYGFIYGKFKDTKKGESKGDVEDRVERPHWRPNYTAIRDKKCEALYDKAVSNVYRYYQFISNMGIALILLAIARWNNSPSSAANAQQGAREREITVTVAFLSVFLLFTAYQQFKGWCRVHNQISSD